MPAPAVRRRCRRLAVLAAIALLAGLGGVLGGCTGVFLQPDRRDYFAEHPPAVPIREVWLRAADGSRLHALHLPAMTAARGTVLFLHGNAENLSSHIRAVDWLPAQGWAVLALDYRGYGRSEGLADLDAAHEDARSALAHLQSQDAAETGPIVVLGQSLGASIALRVVATTGDRRRIAAVIADSGFASYRRIAREKLAAFWPTWPLQAPLSWTISDRQAAIAVIDRIAPIPLLILHGDRDAVVPPPHAAALHAGAAEPKTLWPIEGARHIEALHRPDVRERLLGFLAALGP